MRHMRVHLGRDCTLVAEDEYGVEVESPRRLVPGRPVDLVRDGPSISVRPAVVWTWRVVRMGSSGPRYRGYCRWQHPARERPTRSD